MRSKHILIAAALVALGFGVGRLSAAVGTLDSPDVPGNTWSFTLEDIYNRLNDGTAGAPSTFTEPAAGPGTGTMHDLNEIMAKAPVIDNTNGATETNVLDGKTFWGLTAGQWGAQTGTMPNNGAVTITPTTTNQAIALGYHDGSGEVLRDTDLVSGNIKSGVTIFGVAGDPNVVDTSSGTATASDILSDTVAYVDGLEITGTMTNNVAVTITPTTTSQAIALGYHDGSGEVLGDTDLVSGNIKSGVDIFGVSGNVHGGCTCTGIITPTGGTRWCDNGDGTVTDLTNCLVWLQDANCIGMKEWADTSTNDDAVTWASILFDGSWAFSGSSDCGLSDSSTEGDWRLPTKNELYDLTHGTEQVRSSTPGAFTGVQSYHYWSSTTDVSNTDFACQVDLRNGDVQPRDKTTYTRYVWPVRGGQ